jgi:hypothetical protein
VSLLYTVVYNVTPGSGWRKLGNMTLLPELDIAYNPMRIARYTNFAAFVLGAVLVFLEMQRGPLLLIGVTLMVSTFVAELVMRSIEERPVPPSNTHRPKGFPIEPKEKK